MILTFAGALLATPPYPDPNSPNPFLVPITLSR
jgi:hypothetical protein